VMWSQRLTLKMSLAAAFWTDAKLWIWVRGRWCRVGSGQYFGGSGWVGSKMNKRTNGHLW